MDMSSKMDGSAPVSQALGGVWEIQKKGRIDDQRKENRKKDKDRKEEETEFEDGLVPKEEEITTDTEAGVQKEESDPKDESPSTTRKIDIII
jgi:hypothetical protein